ncbi:PREDICTED: uncharacterized protein LOC108804394 [Nanorana parkeri]|uniref:uncharacterized protein LOC108804394 n=1 Tax=Nanorana parkeri TaxID=125878 RepID=UPI0008545815|nr:PREDICTED: uncharacterized protein LOC108804394 [Nanorana parkeri]
MNNMNRYELSDGEEEGEDAGGSVRPLISALQQKRRNLILHLDLNNTILVSDTATGQGLREALNSYLSTVTWGRISNTGEWEWISDQPSVKPPSPDAINYNTQFGRDGNFSDSKIGRRFKEVFTRHLDLLQWQGEADDTFTQSGEDGKLYHWILPSFFHLLSTLHQQGRHFSVILRTFGSDLPLVLQSVHATLAGKHPYFPELKELPLSVELTPGRIRCNKRENVLTRGADRVSTKGRERNIYDYFTAMSGIGGFQDHFDWWARNSFTSTGGKPFWIDPNDCDNLHLIIDDNIRLSEQDTDTIVNCRVLLDQGRGKESRKVPTSELYDICLVQTDLLRAIAEKDYFLDCVRSCEENYENYLQSFQLE